MGELYLHDLNKYNCNIFIETGTGRGTGLTHALKFNFEKVYSIEINEILYEECKKNENFNKAVLFNGSSVDGLKSILPSIGKDKKILFWLDAHFPGADFQLSEYDADIPNNIKLPLKSEIEYIKSTRDKCKDVFILDDLQLFEDGEYELKLPSDFINKYRTSNQFIYDTYSETHDFYKDYRHQGFLILVPKI